MLKQILEEKNISTYRFAKDIKEPYSTINDIVNGKVDIEDCKVKLLKKIADYLEQSLEQTYQQCKLNSQVYSKEYRTKGEISVRHKKYYLSFQDESDFYEIEVCKVTELSSMYIAEVALYEMEKLLSRKKAEMYLCNM